MQITILKKQGLIPCLIRKRINKFVVEVEVNGELAYAHLANTGKLEDLLIKGKRCYCERIKGKKLSFRLLAVSNGNSFSIIDTKLHEEIFIRALEIGILPWARNCSLQKRNVKIGKEVIDFLMTCNSISTYVELKSAVLKLNERFASYPDTETKRGKRQIRALAENREDGTDAIVLFVSSLPSVDAFKPCCRCDEEILDTIRHASEKGVKFKCINVIYDEEKSEVILEDSDVPVILDC